MAKKKKETVWHKKRNTFLPPSVLKNSHVPPKAQTDVPKSSKSKIELFREIIKDAVKKRTGD